MSEADGGCNKNHTFSFLAVADPIDRRHRAQAAARRLAPGMACRAAIPRAAACGVGAARLADQAQPVRAQHGRLLGRALAAELSMGGRDVSRPALWRAYAVQAERAHF